MNDDVYVSVGEFLGMLPYASVAGMENVSTHMVGTQLIRLDPASTEVLAFCRNVRTADELDEWIDDQNGVTDAVIAHLVEGGLLRHGPASQAAVWLADRVLVPAGHSAGLVDGALCLLAPSGTAFRVDGVYYWLWLYARSGSTLDSVRAFLDEQGQVKGTDDAAMSAAVMHMLIHGLARIDAPGT